MLFRYLSFPVGGNLSFVLFCDNRIRLVGWYDGRACVSLCPPQKKQKGQKEMSPIPYCPSYSLLLMLSIVYSLRKTPSVFWERSISKL